MISLKGQFWITLAISFVYQHKVASASDLFIRTETVSRPICKISHYETGTGPVCGTIYKEERTSNCPAIEAEDSRCPKLSEVWDRNPVCGPEKYKKGRGKVCGVGKNVFLSPSDKEWSAIKDGSNYAGTPGQFAFFGYCHKTLSLGGVPNRLKSETIVSKKTVSVSPGRMPGSTVSLVQRSCTYEYDNECEHSSFGVERWNNCVVGTTYQRCVIGYESCRHHNHEIESHLTCRDQSFGIVYNSCEVPDVPAQEKTIESLGNQAVALHSAKSALVSASLSSPTNALLISVKATLERSLLLLQQELQSLQSSLAVTSDPIKISDLNDEILESSKTVDEILAAIKEVDGCLSHTSGSVCRVDYSVAITQLENQIEKTKSDLKSIKLFLESEVTRLSALEADLVKQIQILLGRDELTGI